MGRAPITLYIRVPATALWAGLALASGAVSQERDWCESEARDARRHCEVRELTLAPTGALRVDARPNGGIQVAAWSREEVRIEAKVVSRAEDSGRARDISRQISIATGPEVRAEGPSTRRDEGWWVSYRIRVPARYDLRLESTNGGLGVEGVSGRLDLSTTNGGIHLAGTAGSVTARTTNGGLDIALSGDRWEGTGLDAETTNGGVTLSIPDGYSARLETGTRNGGFEVDFPITVSGRIGRRLSTELGAGGPPVRVLTTNGGVRVRRR